jgi:hypothetical protein
MSKRDFAIKEEVVNRRRTEKSEVLNKSETGWILVELNKFLENIVAVKRLRNGEHQALETFVNEETQLFVKFLKGAIINWAPRIPGIN